MIFSKSLCVTNTVIVSRSTNDWQFTYNTVKNGVQTPKWCILCWAWEVYVLTSSRLSLGNISISWYHRSPTIFHYDIVWQNAPTMSDIAGWRIFMAIAGRQIYDVHKPVECSHVSITAADGLDVPSPITPFSLHNRLHRYSVRGRRQQSSRPPCMAERLFHFTMLLLNPPSSLSWSHSVVSFCLPVLAVTTYKSNYD